MLFALTGRILDVPGRIRGMGELETPATGRPVKFQAMGRFLDVVRYARNLRLDFTLPNFRAGETFAAGNITIGIYLAMGDQR